MTTAEFSNQFDVLYDNALSNMAPGLSEYDKSVFLTQAQKEVIQAYYGGAGDTTSFEGTEEARRALSTLVITFKNSVILADTHSEKLAANNSYLFSIPSEAWFIAYEEAILVDDTLPSGTTSTAIVIPTTHDDYFRTYRNPFRGPNDSQVLKLDISDNRVELISKYTVETYVMRYIAMPTPIVLDTLIDAEIDGVTVETECALHESLHMLILKRAVETATKVYNYQNK
jgi:hypothetical protein